MSQGSPLFHGGLLEVIEGCSPVENWRLLLLLHFAKQLRSNHTIEIYRLPLLPSWRGGIEC
jgi:hypothetical protein